MFVRFALPALLCSTLVHAAQVTVFKDQNFQGPELALEQAANDLIRVNFQDQISSIVVHHGAWQVCTQPGFQGDCMVLQPGSYATLPARINHRIESMREAPVRNAALGVPPTHRHPRWCCSPRRASWGARMSSRRTRTRRS